MHHITAANTILYTHMHNLGEIFGYGPLIINAIRVHDVLSRKRYVHEDQSVFPGVSKIGQICL